ncbi:hypothetical protein R1sor_009469 [Riccia sorocarpa]|uniref:Uncharacterized protein n=1 Tax=Riccia sorocarpa TaxID=122646 RepID=A0ABD3HVF8_9MARC
MELVDQVADCCFTEVEKEVTEAGDDVLVQVRPLLNSTALPPPLIKEQRCWKRALSGFRAFLLISHSACCRKVISRRHMPFLQERAERAFLDEGRVRDASIFFGAHLETGGLPSSLCDRTTLIGFSAPRVVESAG